jgi:subtilisin family serine protease
MSSIVVRRFEMQVADEGALNDVENKLGQCVDEHVEARGVTTVEIRSVPRPPTLQVRLQGEAPAIAKVRECAEGIRADVRIHRDFLEVPAARRQAVPREVASLASLGADTYPDADTYPYTEALLRIDPERESRHKSLPETDGEQGLHGQARKVIVAVVDSGIMDTHPNLKNHMWKGCERWSKGPGARYIGRPPDADTTDRDGHGTLVAGTILATADDSSPVEIMAVKFWDVDVPPAADNAAEAINFAVEHGAHIINLSWDLGIGSSKLREAIRGACAKQDGPLIVIAAGNAGTNNDHYPSVPACYAEECREKIIVVMATDRYNEKAWFSNYGRESVDLAAPGVEIESTRPFLADAGIGSKRYRRYTGTSPAAAHVTGAAALIKSLHPAWGAKILKCSLFDSVHELPGLKCRSGGRLDLVKALAWRPSTGLNPAVPPASGGWPDGRAARDPG